ncbi:hypothetical protein [Proteiniphilum saccharofermentans]|uniref:hypothetical protein n=1 Tax=Proteiniphilum saccharofermentans TaxID=1642647 RepID=UPI0028AFD835|nr:hypothetical protein [Proteiniphilum saccharofermentans]
MKNFNFLLLSLITLFFSCDQQDESLTVLNNEEKTDPYLIVNENPSQYEWEESFNPYRSLTTRSATENSVQFSVARGINPYVGGIFKKEGINNSSFASKNSVKVIA